jgi:8-oxo-dGTP pyrophosphatase MutT (NUDIX family)
MRCSKAAVAKEKVTEAGKGMSAVAGKAAVIPVKAATVVLVRDGPVGLEVCLPHRQRGMVFAPEAWVFPGGKVDRADSQFDQGLRTHPHVISLARRLQQDATGAGTLVAAAVRETIEETGIVLGGPAGLVPAELRHDLETGACTLTDLLAALDTTPDLSNVQLWSRWITPVSEPRRYDTYFHSCPAQWKHWRCTQPGSVRTGMGRCLPRPGRVEAREAAAPTANFYHLAAACTLREHRSCFACRGSAQCDGGRSTNRSCTGRGEGDPPA